MANPRVSSLSDQSDAQAAAAVPQRRVCLLLRQPDGPGGDAQAVQHKGQVAQLGAALLARAVNATRRPMRDSISIEFKQTFLEDKQK